MYSIATCQTLPLFALSSLQRVTSLRVLSDSVANHSLRRRKSCSRRKRSTPSSRLLFALHRAYDQVLDRVRCGGVPPLCQRCPAGRSCHSRGAIGDSLLRISHQHRAGRIGQIRKRFPIAQPDLRVLRGSDEVESVRAPLPIAQHRGLRLRWQAIVPCHIRHFNEIG